MADASSRSLDIFRTYPACSPECPGDTLKFWSRSPHSGLSTPLTPNKLSEIWRASLCENTGGWAPTNYMAGTIEVIRVSVIFQGRQWSGNWAEHTGRNRAIPYPSSPMLVFVVGIRTRKKAPPEVKRRGCLGHFNHSVAQMQRNKTPFRLTQI